MQVRSLVRKISWRRKWQPTLVLLPGEFHGQRSLAGYSPQGCKELDAAQRGNTHRLRRCRRAHFADTGQEKPGDTADFRAGRLSRTEGLYL